MDKDLKVLGIIAILFIAIAAVVGGINWTSQPTNGKEMQPEIEEPPPEITVQQELWYEGEPRMVTMPFSAWDFCYMLTAVGWSSADITVFVVYENAGMHKVLFNIDQGDTFAIGDQLYILEDVGNEVVTLVKVES